MPPSRSRRRLGALLLFAGLALAFQALGPGPCARTARADEQDDVFLRAPDPATAPGPDADLFVEAVALQQAGKFKAARKKFWKLIDDYPTSPYRSEAEDRSGDRDGGNAFLGIQPMGPIGPSERRIDVAMMGDGYLLEKQDVFEKHAQGELDLLLGEPAYGEYRSYFNFWRFSLGSQDDGVDETAAPPDPEEQERRGKRKAKKKREPRQYVTALDCKAAGPQGQVMADRERVYHYLQYLDVNDALAICFAQKGILGMGGGGIATTAPRGVVVHEFGHAFAYLLDEYAVNPTPPQGQVQAANATTNPERPPWQHFLDAKVPQVGVFEGGATFQKGVWRPAASCAMNTGGGDPYCPVCREQTILTIYSYVSPIDEASPAEKTVEKGPKGWPPFRVLPMTPANHALEVRWFLGTAPVVTGEATKPPPGETGQDEELTPEERRLRERQKAAGRDPAPVPEPPPLPDVPPDDQLPVPSLDGPDGPVRPRAPEPLAPMFGRVHRAHGTANDPPPVGKEIAAKKDKLDGGRVASIATIPADLAPGKYLLTAVVRDRTLLKGERFPWVLKDDKGLLEDRHAWVLVVPDGVGK